MKLALTGFLIGHSNWIPNWRPNWLSNWHPKPGVLAGIFFTINRYAELAEIAKEPLAEVEKEFSFEWCIPNWNFQPRISKSLLGVRANIVED